MSQDNRARFLWRDVYLRFLRGFDPSVRDSGLKRATVRRSFGELPLVEGKMIDIRATNGRVEIIKAIFQSDTGFVILTTLEGHKEGSVYYF